ncbi:MAG: LapA family protein [Nitrospirota bacterium]
MITIVLALVIVTLVTIFSVQNAKPVAISFLFWRFEASLAIVIFLSVLTGVIIASIIATSAYIKRIKKQSKPSE